MTNEIKFRLSDKQYIQVIVEPIEKSSCGVCAECNLDYVDEENGLIIRFGYTEAETFNGVFGYRRINELLNNELFFDNKTRRDPGFEYNQYCQDLIKDTDVVDKYFFESNSHTDMSSYYTSWFYNDKDGNIIFEISPYYRWFNVEDAEIQPGFVTYKDFMKDYQIIVRKVIPKETLIGWNNQAKAYKHVCYD